MANGAAGLASWVDTGKNLFALLRDFVLFVLLALLAGCPQVIGSRLSQAGLTEVDALGVKWKAKVEESQKRTLAAGGAVDQTQAKIDQVLAKIDQTIAARPDLKTTLAPLKQEAQQSSLDLSKAQTQLLDAATTQQTVLARNSAQPAVSGWLYLGSLNQAKTGWQTRTTDAPWPVTTPYTATITDGTYIRREGAPLQRRLAPPLAVASEGARVTIESVDASVPLKAGGWTVWARVTLQP